MSLAPPTEQYTQRKQQQRTADRPLCAGRPQGGAIIRGREGFDRLLRSGAERRIGNGVRVATHGRDALGSLAPRCRQRARVEATPPERRAGDARYNGHATSHARSLPTRGGGVAA